jgi:4-hydroxybenzoate polyprenyltransferase
MVIIGVLTTRIGIGVGRLTTNLIFGTITYFLLAFSTHFLIKTLRSETEFAQNDRKSQKNARIIFGVLCGGGIGVAIIQATFENLGFSNIIVATSIGCIWLFLGHYADKKENKDFITSLIISLTFTFGVIYGAALNAIHILSIPLFIFLFFFSASFLQLSREIVKGRIGFDYDEKNRLKIALVFQINAIIFLLLPFYSDLATLMLFIYPMIAGSIVMGIAAILTYKETKEKPVRNAKKIAKLLRVGILIEIIAFIFACA